MSRTIMLAWHNDPELKREVSARMLQHRVEDSIVQGIYQELAPDKASQYRGCLIGCTLPLTDRQPDGHGGFYLPSIPWHKRVENLYGIPQELAHVFDCLFEELPKSRAAWFAVNTIEAIPVGADLSVVIDQFCSEVVQAHKRSRARYKGHLILGEQDNPEWLYWVLQVYLGGYADETAKKKTIMMAEKLLQLLASAPVAGSSEPVPFTPVEFVEPTKEEADRLLDEILKEITA